MRRKIAGLAGGVGTTAIATALGFEDCGRNIAEADILVAVNDFRCAQVITQNDDHVKGKTIVLVLDRERPLSVEDFESILPPRTRLVVTYRDLSIARADDAGLLEFRPPKQMMQLKELL